MVFADADLNTYLNERISFWTMRLLGTHFFQWADGDDLVSEFTLALLQSQENYDAARSSARTYYSHVVDTTAQALYRRHRYERSHCQVCRDDELPERPASLDGKALDYARGLVPSGIASGTIDARLTLERLSPRLPIDLRLIVQRCLDGDDRDAIGRALGFSHATLSRKLILLRAYLEAFESNTRRVTPICAASGVPTQKGDTMETRMVTTYTMWQNFRNCRKACYWRYVRELAPRGSSHAQHLGTVMHDALQRWHQDRDLDAVMTFIDQACADRSVDEEQRQCWHGARAMMDGYARRYADESFHVLALEAPFAMPIRNPATGRVSRRFRLAGKVDGIVEEEGRYYLLEHKTTSHLDGDYLERLWLDLQISLYSRALETIHHIPIAGVIYNVLCKAQLKQGKGETEAEFLTRRAELLAKNKSGKTSATRKESESDAAFQQRLRVKYDDPAMFHREVILFTPDQYAELEAELWELTQQFQDALKRGAFYRNTSQCFAYGRPCSYYPLCRAGGAEHIIPALYEQRPAHEELRDASTEVNAPLF